MLNDIDPSDAISDLADPVICVNETGENLICIDSPQIILQDIPQTCSASNCAIDMIVIYPNLRGTGGGGYA